MTDGRVANLESEMSGTYLFVPRNPGRLRETHLSALHLSLTSLLRNRSGGAIVGR